MSIAQGNKKNTHKYDRGGKVGVKVVMVRLLKFCKFLSKLKMTTSPKNNHIRKSTNM